MRKLLSNIAVATALATAPLTVALAHEGHSHGLPVVTGVVTKVDAGAGTVTIKHAAIPNLQMEAHDHRVQSPQSLDAQGPEGRR